MHVRSLAFSHDHTYVAWGDYERMNIKSLATILTSGEKIRDRPITEPEDVPLLAEIIPNQETFECSLGGRTAEEFSGLLGAGGLPPGPPVNLIFKLKNSSDRKVTLYDPDKVVMNMYLFGPGAMNLSLRSCQTGVGPGGPPPNYVSPAPRCAFSFPLS